jgi:hypothetical protein
MWSALVDRARENAFGDTWLRQSVAGIRPALIIEQRSISIRPLFFFPLVLCGRLLHRTRRRTRQVDPVPTDRDRETT